MAMGTVQQKQVVLTAIADDFRPAFTPALASALNDPEPAVRVQAATVSARIENTFMERSLLLEERRNADPEDPEALLALAQHHDEWAATGLLDVGRTRSERLEALQNYRHLEVLRPGAPVILDAIGRLLLALDLPEQALAYLQAGARAERPATVLALYLECLYRLRRTAELREAARRHWPRIAASALPAEVRESVRAWAGGIKP